MTKMTKNELIDILKSDEYLKYSGDALCKWLIDLKYAYADSGENEDLDELVQSYWPPEDVIEYLISQLRSPVLDPIDAMEEVGGLLHYKDYKTTWSYLGMGDESYFVDVNDENLHQLRLRMLEVLTREEENEID